ncbi:MAG: hypothetical protein JWO30_4842 [Fibrobacteres bacterium]|nr:hypothetical protein [Fibrobacterota bacterium]
MNRNRIIVAVMLVSLPFATLLYSAEAAKPAAATAKAPAPAATLAAAPAKTGVTAAPAAMGTTASADKITLVRPTASTEILSEPSKVWKKLVSAEGMNAFGVAEEKKKSLEKVGDNVRATVAGDAGNLVVTHVVKDSDWRAAFEPENGNYVCSIRFSLKAQGNNTLLVYSDWYSDEKPAMIDQNLKETEKSMTESLARFKGMIEKTSASGNP